MGLALPSSCCRPTQDSESAAKDEITPYSICLIPGKGFGLIAATEIPRGRLILSEAPLFQYNGRDFNDGSEAWRKYNRLKREEKIEISKLANIQSSKNSWEDLDGVLRTNGIKLNDPSQVEAYGLFVIASRINHSCLPNTHSSWDPAKKTIEIYATRDIPQGEEITSTYAENLAGYALRQKAFEAVFKFTCRCCLCALPQEARKQSDIRIEEINRRLGQEIWRLDQVLVLLRLYEDESIVDKRPVDAYEAAWDLSIRFGDSKKAHVFAKRGAQLCAEVEGFDGVNTIEWRKRVEESARYAEGPGNEDTPEDGENFEEWLFGKLQARSDFDGWGQDCSEEINPWYQDCSKSWEG